jgi:hypothetical protein
MAIAEAPAPQRLRALEQANRVRSARARLKREMATGVVSAAEVIERCPSEVETMPIGELLRSQPRWGPARCSRLLLSAGITDGRPLAALTERRRRDLVARLRSS